MAISVVFAQVPDGDLPDDGAQRELKICNDCEVVKLNESQMNSIRFTYTGETECPFKAQTIKKSEVFTMQVLMKDEKKYTDCVDVLDQLEEWTHQIYSAAGYCDLPESAD
ncbi:Hypothetical predicted protein [Paramuricea clavata]|uniref:Uncharacterized protein n=1 Tax=Paramuricea clavata TaxID=317549 RepID=A0A7D9J5W3_PARCT|nr:Hypothetical predicted protein [Paramuricea clavata]